MDFSELDNLPSGTGVGAPPAGGTDASDGSLDASGPTATPGATPQAPTSNAPPATDEFGALPSCSWVCLWVTVSSFDCEVVNKGGGFGPVCIG